METLASLRQDIDRLDDEIVERLLKRLRDADGIARAKESECRPFFDPTREREVLSRVTEKAGDAATGADLRRIYATLLSVSKARQRAGLSRTAPILEEIAKAEAKGREPFPDLALVACSGGEGSYAQKAASRLFAVPKVLYFNGFEKVFEAVEKGLCAYGILPVENSSAGSVTAVYDLMQRHKFHIVRSIRLKVNHVLLGLPSARLEDVREISSHPHALAQCSAYLKAHPAVHARPASNTAVAARELAASGRTDCAVIASRDCAELYGLKVLADQVMDSSFNYTRFICIAREMALYPRTNKYALMLSLPHQSGSLGEVLSRFSVRGINLTKLESRPVLGSAFEFRFVFEFEATPDAATVKGLLAELATDPDIEEFVFLGGYEEMV